LDFYTFSKNTSTSHPAIDATPVVADLKPLALNGLDQMQILIAIDFTLYVRPSRQGLTQSTPS
jgi:hypothetical protein